MRISAQLIAAANLDMSEYKTAHSHLVLVVSIASLVGVFWAIFVLIRKQNRYLPHSQTLILFIFQILASTRRIIDVLVEEPVIIKSYYKYLFYFITMVGYYGTCINTALLGVAMYIITSLSTKHILKISFILNLLGITAPCILCGTILAVKHQVTFKGGIGDFPTFESPDEYYIGIAFVILCSLATMVSMMISERQYRKNMSSKDEILDHLTPKKSEMDEKLSLLFSMDSKYGSIDCNECGWERKQIVCSFKVGSYHLCHHNCQLVQHTFLILCLTFCMLVGKLYDGYIINI